MVSDAENTTNRKRPERLQQKTQVRSPSPAVAHSIYGNIHSRESIKSQGRENAELPKPPQQHGEYHSDGSPAIREEIPPGRSASSGLRSAVPSAPAEGGLLPAERSPSGPSKHTGGVFRSVSAVGYPGSCRICSGGSLVCIRGDEPNAFPHFIVRLSCSAEMWQGTAAEDCSSTSARLFCFFPPNTRSLFRVCSSYV